MPVTSKYVQIITGSTINRKQNNRTTEMVCYESMSYAVANAFGEAEPDLNGDGVVNIQDLVIVANAFE